jgi:ArsR family transcriptional regulator
MIVPDSLFGIFSDSTRLRALMLIQSEGELCVCELTFALNEIQPKVSRHLALMRDAGIVESRREGTWIHYRINPSLPEWSKELIGHVSVQLKGLSPYREDKKQLMQMSNRPERNCT